MMHMEYQEINKLLDRYWSGASTLEEEHKLKQYFSSNEVSPKHGDFRPYFSFLEQEAQRKTNRNYHLPGKLLLRKRLHWLAVAASILVLLTSILFFNRHQATKLQAKAEEKIDWSQFECENEADCLEELKQVLFLSSITLNKGEKKTLLSIKEIKDINNKINRKK